MLNEANEIYTVYDIMDILKIGENTAYRLLNEGKIKAFRIGKSWRIQEKSLQEYINDSEMNNSV